MLQQEGGDECWKESSSWEAHVANSSSSLPTNGEMRSLSGSKGTSGQRVTWGIDLVISDHMLPHQKHPMAEPAIGHQQSWCEFFSKMVWNPKSIFVSRRTPWIVLRFFFFFFKLSHNCTFHFRVIPVGNLPNLSETRRNRLARAAAKALTPLLKGGTTVSSVGQ